jgi:hypothetical protein
MNATCSGPANPGPHPARRNPCGLPALIAALGAFFLAAPGAPAAEIFLRANQLGYGPDAAKLAVAFSTAPLPPDFAVVEAVSRNVVLTGRGHVVSGVRWGQFENHADLDFSPLRQPGRYVLRLGATESLPFTIGAGTYRDLPDALLDFMRQQRCGYNPWLDAHCHQFDGKTAYGPLPAGTHIDVRGGWHDAADQLKYLITSANATAQMLLAYQIGRDDALPGPARKHAATPATTRPPAAPFADQFNALGQPGANGIPDLLDEARWGLDWMLKLHPAPDQLYHQVADDRDHCGPRLPQNEFADYGWGKGSYRVVYCADGKPQGLRQYQSESTGLANLAGRYAAAMALAYQIWKDDPRHAAFAQQCLQAGQEVYALGQANEGVQQGNSYTAPYRYEECSWADDMEWGAAELYRATRQRRYLTDAKRYAKLAADEGWMGREQTKHYECYPFMNVGHFRLYDLVDRRFQRRLAGYYRAGIERCERMGGQNPYRIGVPFIWCSNNLVAALVTQCRLYERMTGDARYCEFAARQRDWLLGRNPWGYTMFTGIGTVFPRDTHMTTFRLTGRTARGGLVDGPVYERIFKSLKGVSITEPDPLAAFHGELAVYHDDYKDYSTNEPTMDGTASAILMFVVCQE